MCIAQIKLQYFGFVFNENLYLFENIFLKIRYTPEDPVFGTPDKS